MKGIKVRGMSCQHCVQAVRNALEELGMTGVAVDLQSGSATFTPTTAFSEEQVAEAIDEAGFTIESFE